MSRKNDNTIKMLQSDVRDKAELKKELNEEKVRCASLEAKNVKKEKKNNVVMKKVGSMDIEVMFSTLRNPNYNNEMEKKIRNRHLSVVDAETNHLQEEV